MNNINTINAYCISLGCPKNRVDTERLLGSITKNIYITDNIKKANFIFINTCAFILPAIKESIKTVIETIDEIKNYKKKPILAVGGCLIGRYNLDELKKEIPEVNIWLSAKDINNWPKLIQKEFEIIKNTRKDRIVSTYPYAWLKIGEGCQHKCSFCTIPSIKGPLSSENIDDLIIETKKLTDNGIKEIILVSQDVTSFGFDRKEKGLIPLLEKLLKIKDLHWLRLLYCYPTGITTDLLKFMNEHNKKLISYLDIPIQHSHKDILKSMGRPFKCDPRNVIENIRKHLPNAIIRSTVITGYPNESEEHFNDLCQFVKEGYCNHLGVFSYEAEEGTKAEKLPNQIPNKIKTLRRKKLLSLQKKVSRKWLKEFIGKNLEILVENRNPEWDGLFNGRAWFQAPEIDGIVYISGKNVECGKIINAEIIESSDYDLTALA